MLNVDVCASTGGVVRCAYDSCGVTFRRGLLAAWASGTASSGLSLMNMLRSQQGDTWGHEMLPLACGGQPVYLLPLAGVPLHSDRMLGDKFRPPAHPPSAAASCRTVSMGTGARLPRVKLEREAQTLYPSFCSTNNKKTPF